MSLPAFELRARYVVSMRISYSPIVLWRSLRKTLTCLELLRRPLDVKIAQLQRRTHHYWLQPRVSRYLQHLCGVLDKIIAECRRVMDELVDGRFSSRLISVDILKQVPWFLAYQHLFEGVVHEVVMEKDMPFFQYKRPWSLEGPRTRRFSTGTTGVIELGNSLRQRWGVEMMVSQWLRRVEEAFVKDLLQLRSKYNSGEVFQSFGEHIFRESQRDCALYKQQNKPWKYEDYNFQLRTVDLKGELPEIPRAEEDEMLRSLVQL